MVDYRNRLPERCSVVILTLALICPEALIRPVTASAQDSAGTVQFVDVTASAGIDFVHHHGGFGKKYPTETMGSGVALLDYDGDGWLDLYFVGSENSGRLYHNDGDGTFTDVTVQAGVESSAYGLGCAVGDYDGDGDLDLYVTCYGDNELFSNNGDGTFTEVAAAAGVIGQYDNGWTTGAAFGDIDKDGDQDLYSPNYAEFRPETFETCVRSGGINVYCGPEAFEAQPDEFFLNNGDGTFTEVGEKVGLVPLLGKELGAFFVDYDQDRDLDLYVAGDRTPNLLYRNDGGVFTEVGNLAGVAYNDAGKPLAGMGVDVGDFDNDGLFDFFVTNYQWETNSLYRNVGDGFFTDVTFQSGLGVPSLKVLAWGTVFFDADNDGDRDIFVANGHLDDNVHLFDAISYPQQNHLFRNDGAGLFTDISAASGPGMQLVEVSRGAAFGDFDNDGDLDLAVSNNNQRCVLLRNDGASGNWISLRMEGRVRTAAGAVVHNAGGLGTEVRLWSGGRQQIDVVRSGSSYMCQNDLRLHFGLGTSTTVDSIVVHWPAGDIQTVTKPPINQVLTIRQN